MALIDQEPSYLFPDSTPVAIESRTTTFWASLVVQENGHRITHQETGSVILSQRDRVSSGAAYPPTLRTSLILRPEEGLDFCRPDLPDLRGLAVWRPCLGLAGICSHRLFG
jgi:hypothetical protein